MKVLQVYINNPLRNFNYILYSEKTNEAIIFDPTEINMVLDEVAKHKLQAKYLLNTHQHFDHIKGNKEFLNLPNTQKITLQDGEFFELSATEKLECRYTPGHVMDHYCYFLYEHDELVGVISGDTVFQAGVGNCKNGGDPQTLYKTIRNIFLPLDDRIVIYPSHDYFETNLNFALSIEPENENTKKYLNKVQDAKSRNEFILTTIGEEKLYNPFFRLFCSEFEWRDNLSEKEKFLEIRKLRDNW
ncbi:MAG: hydroxyacylglutathione hydrolase C-terminal domain-containing protein [Bacteriovoracaceae bacterium]|jgi:hydroxyacylglutathione hydrolase|nr:hypothetical protein [Halobacteriovoraceae bacterium]MDP7319768.1 hydroxyacylglutathione hydrolase C-terminal domain-containing protein [Bacteriovoracaceae bacterium]|tara:strand:+ start:464 stop:1195 length:732 start_codon:yes stop_codon:yes gene_type:complete